MNPPNDTAPVDPGEGYRLLEAYEIITYPDEVWSNYQSRWDIAQTTGERADWSRGQTIYRRRIVPPVSTPSVSDALDSASFYCRGGDDYLPLPDAPGYWAWLHSDGTWMPLEVRKIDGELRGHDTGEDEWYHINVWQRQKQWRKESPYIRRIEGQKREQARINLLAAIIHARSVDTPDPKQRLIRFAEYAQAANVLTREDATEAELLEQVRMLKQVDTHAK